MTEKEVVFQKKKDYISDSLKIFEVKVLPTSRAFVFYPLNKGKALFRKDIDMQRFGIIWNYETFHKM